VAAGAGAGATDAGGGGATVGTVAESVEQLEDVAGVLCRVEVQ
jgi:hypothetical protein